MRKAADDGDDVTTPAIPHMQCFQNEKSDQPRAAHDPATHGLLIVGVITIRWRFAGGPARASSGELTESRPDLHRQLAP
jgi:hypothetical protein